jgi:hypothetical protein
MDHDTSETMAAETIEWPFLKAQRDGGDPEVSTAAASDGDSTRPSSEGPANNGHYEIVVSNSDVPSSTTFNTSSDGSNHQFETCLISNADLVALANANGVDPSSIKIETGHDGRIQYSGSDAVHYFDPEATLACVDSEEQQRMIKVYQTAMESGDNKLITVYEIKPEEEGGGLHVLDGGHHSSSGDGRDVMVEIVHSPEDEQLLRSVTEDGTLVMPSSMSGSSFHHTLVNLPQSYVSAPTTVAELRCTLCGFVSFARDEIAEHCMTAHDLFLCQTCNLVFKRRQSLQAHARAKHGQSAPQLPSIVTSTSAANSRSGPSPKGRAARGVAKRRGGGSVGSTLVGQKRPYFNLSSPASSSLTGHRIDMMSDIKDILAKNKAVLPVLTYSSSPSTPIASTSSLTGKSSRGGGGGSSGKKGGKRSSAHDWARVGSLTAQQQQQLMLDSRLSDPQTRHQFNTEFAKKITSHGIGAEVLGLAEERLPSKKGTYRLDIKERVLENGAYVPVGTAKRDCASGAVSENVDVFYNYDIVDTKIPTADGGCKVICGLCHFSNSRIENVLFHCEIDHKQYYCHNKRCQNGFSSWDSLMRHMKTVHKRDK